MKAFTYERVDTAEEAVAANARTPGARFIAGGTNLLDLMKIGIEAPSHLIDVNGTGLDRIEEIEDGRVRIGALVRNHDLAAHARIRRDYPVLSRAIIAGASGQLRNMATTGGNLMQRTRCPYFYDVNLPCNKRDPGSGCAAMGGYTRRHAIVGIGGNCICPFPSDMSVGLRVLDAVVEVMRPDGTTRSIPIADFHQPPGVDDKVKEFALEPGELILAVVLPGPAGGRQFYHKVRDRASYAFALVSVAAVIQADGSGRIALGGVGTIPWRSDAGDAALQKGAKAVADALLTEAVPMDQNQYKLALTERTIALVLAEAKG